MANFITYLLEENQKNFNKAKRFVIEDTPNKPSSWIVKNCGLLMIVFNVIIACLILIVAIVTFPILLLMMTINAPYCLYKWIRNHTWFRTRYIKDSLATYEEALNKKFAYDLRSSNNEVLICSPNNLEAFLKRFFQEYNFEYYTCIAGGKNIVCGKNRRRSIEDLYLISKHYLPNITLNELIKTLIKLVNGNVLAVSKCSEIRRYVFTNRSPYTGLYMEKDLEFMNGVNFKQLMDYYAKN